MAKEGNTESIENAPDSLRLDDKFSEVFSLVCRKSGHDFSGYKKSTVMRRIRRRMQVTNCSTLEDYLTRLQSDEHEPEKLFKELLIGVTQFFRDPESFAALEAQVLRPLLQESAGPAAVRIWVPGCATGEEAYTIAILLSDLMAEIGTSRHVQVFATDLDVEALDVARRGCFPETIVQDVSPARLTKYFRRTQFGFELIPEIREMCVFSAHNLIKDAPFSRLDLISCRNVLIYLEADAQKTILPVFHYSLNPSGHLFLGPAENIAARSEFFRVVDQKHRIFQRRPVTAPRQKPLSMVDGVQFSRFKVPAPQIIREVITRSDAPVREPQLARSIERLLIEEFTAASVVINGQGDVVYFSGKAEKFLRPPAGAPTNNLVTLARKPIRLELRMAVQRAIATREPVIRENLVMKNDGELERFRLVVRPLNELGRDNDLFIVAFEELIPSSAPEQCVNETTRNLDESILRHLEDELRTAKEELQSTIGELESSNEELKSANEELLSMNEELQSANEELQTSKEEMQSVNDELQRKIEEVDAANEALHRTLERISDGFVAFDLRWRYTFVNRQAREILFQLKPGEDVIGRCVWEVFPDLVGTDIYLQMHHAMELQRTMTFELEYCGFLFSIRAYPSADGLSVYFQDITQRRIEEERAKEQAMLDAFSAEIGRHLAAGDGLVESLKRCTQSVVNQLDAAFARIWLLNERENVLELKASSGMYTHTDGAHSRIPVGSFKIGMIAAERKPHLTNEVIGDPRVPAQDWAKREGMVSFAGYPLIVEDRLIGVLGTFARHRLSENTLQKMAAIADLLAIGIERMRTAEEVQRSEARFRSLVHASAQVVWNTDANGTVVGDCPSWRELTGQTVEEFNGGGWLNAVHPDDRARALETWENALRQRTPYSCEFRVRRADGVYRWLESRAVPVLDGHGRIREWVGTNTDITAKKEAEELLERTVAERTASLKETIGELEAFSYSVSHDLRSPLRAMQGYAKALLEDCGHKLEAEHQRYLERIVRGANRLDRLTLDVLAYSRLSRREFQPNAIQLEKLMADILDQYPQFGPFRSNIHIQLPLHAVLGHEAYLTQCISNLLGNAVKFVPNGKRPEVRVWTEEVGGAVRLNVEDNGIGIAPEHRDRMFQMFGRVHHDRVYEGTGIGLAVVRKAVEKMGGSVGYESELGKGSRFWIELPKAS